MKILRVVAAVICDSLNNPTSVFATARGHGAFKGQWEFPGGKIENEETPQEALVREIKEELNIDVVVGAFIDTIEYDYPSFHLSMECYWSTVRKGNITLIEAEEGKWLKKDELYSVPWLPADKALIEKITNAMI